MTFFRFMRSSKYIYNIYIRLYFSCSTHFCFININYINWTRNLGRVYKSFKLGIVFFFYYFSLSFQIEISFFFIFICQEENPHIFSSNASLSVFTRNSSFFPFNMHSHFVFKIHGGVYFFSIFSKRKRKNKFKIYFLKQ